MDYLCTYLLAKATVFNDRSKVLEEILAWLIERDIIRPEREIIRYSQDGHRFSEGSKSIFTPPGRVNIWNFSALNTVQKGNVWEAVTTIVFALTAKLTLRTTGNSKDSFIAKPAVGNPEKAMVRYIARFVVQSAI